MKEKLKNYLRNHEVVFQFEDELIEVCYVGSEESFRILKAIDNSESIQRVERYPMMNLGFREIATWSQDQDVLYLIDDFLIINVGPMEIR